LYTRIKETKSLIIHSENENTANWYKKELEDLEKQVIKSFMEK